MEIHHQTLRSKGGDDSEENLITLCTACHSLVHRSF
ncbi:MAG: HNH endonuclease [Acidobacteriia bacterium]|nr:HNH endonuclease [Terriglobia bacterium]